jgi:hypothetical protein
VASAIPERVAIGELVREAGSEDRGEDNGRQACHRGNDQDRDPGDDRPDQHGYGADDQEQAEHGVDSQQRAVGEELVTAAPRGAHGWQRDVQVDADAKGELNDQDDQDGQVGLPQASPASRSLLDRWRGRRLRACHVRSPPGPRLGGTTTRRLRNSALHTRLSWRLR